MSLRPVLTITATVAFGAATLISATPAIAEPRSYMLYGVEMTVCKVVTNERKGAATIFLDLRNTQVATATDDGTRRGYVSVSRTKGNSMRVVSRWEAWLSPGAAASGSATAQQGDEIAIGAGSRYGDAGAVYDLSELPTC